MAGLFDALRPQTKNTEKKLMASDEMECDLQCGVDSLH